MYEIRIFNERYNVSYSYYKGLDDIKERIYANNINELLDKWEENLEKYEGDTYSVWNGNSMMVGGAYDPSDIDILKRYLKGE